MMIREIVKSIIPPIVLDIYRRFQKTGGGDSSYYGIEGEYTTWYDAKKEVESRGYGYDAPEIAEQVRNAIHKVRSGNAVFERDGVLFYHEEFNFPFLTAFLLSVANLDNRKELQVMDFGGSLGSTFFQNKRILEMMGNPLKWNVVEQPNYVKLGRTEVPEIDFYDSIAECVKDKEIDIVLLSSVLSYLEKPYEVIREIAKSNPETIIIDRTLFFDNKEIIGIQRVPPSIYTAQYPNRIMSKSKMLQLLIEHGYELKLEWQSFDKLPYKSKKGNVETLTSQGFLFCRK